MQQIPGQYGAIAVRNTKKMCDDIAISFNLKTRKKKKKKRKKTIKENIKNKNNKKKEKDGKMGKWEERRKRKKSNPLFIDERT